MAPTIDQRPVRLSLSAKSASHSTVFFSHNKSTNNTFSHDLSVKQTWRNSSIRIAFLHIFTKFGQISEL
jgi:hypothetical protein